MAPPQGVREAPDQLAPRLARRNADNQNAKRAWDDARRGGNTMTVPMDRTTRRRLEAYRRQAGNVENTLIDEFAASEMNRSEFIRRGTMFGLSLPLLGGIVGALGEAPLAFAQPAMARAGGRLRVAVIPPPVG